MKVMVPKEVANAFDHHKHLFRNLSESDAELALMAIPFSTVHGEAQILKEYAKANPSMYLRALVYGYRPDRNVEDEIADLVKTWLNTPYRKDPEQDILELAHNIKTKYMK